MLPCVAFLGDVKPNGHAAGCVVMCYRVLPCVAAEGVAGCCSVLQCVFHLFVTSSQLAMKRAAMSSSCDV